MNTDDTFENEMAADLAALAERGPAGPSAERVLSALRQRDARRRWSAAGGVAAAAALAIAVGAVTMRQPEAEMPKRTAQATSRTVDVTSPRVVHRASMTSDTHVAARADDPAWSLFPASLSIAVTSDASPASAHDAHADWDLSLNLSLALSEPAELASPLWRLSSPSWR